MARTFCPADVAFYRGATTALLGGLVAGYTVLVAKIVRRRQAIPLANRERPAVPPKP